MSRSWRVHALRGQEDELLSVSKLVRGGPTESITNIVHLAETIETFNSAVMDPIQDLLIFGRRTLGGG